MNIQLLPPRTLYFRVLSNCLLPVLRALRLHLVLQSVKWIRKTVSSLVLSFLLKRSQTGNSR